MEPRFPVIPTAAPEGAMLFGQRIGNIRSPRFATFGEMIAFKFPASPDLTPASTPLNVGSGGIGAFIAVLADREVVWSAYTGEWVHNNWPAFEHYPERVDNTVDLDTFHMLRSMGIEDKS